MRLTPQFLRMVERLRKDALGTMAKVVAYNRRLVLSDTFRREMEKQGSGLMRPELEVALKHDAIGKLYGPNPLLSFVRIRPMPAMSRAERAKAKVLAFRRWLSNKIYQWDTEDEE